MAKRQIALDTETTGFRFDEGHRIIEIGCVEMIDRKPTGETYHVYINPERDVPQSAVEVHGITTDFLQDKPLFEEVVDDFIEFITRGGEQAELIIHNAAFDEPFLDAEIQALNRGLPKLAELCLITDTLVMARKAYPGKRNSLDALCSRFEIDNSHRTLHGALLDSEILLDVYLRMTGGQIAFSLQDQGGGAAGIGENMPRVDRTNVQVLPVIDVPEELLEAHDAMLERMASGQGCVWKTGQ